MSVTRWPCPEGRQRRCEVTEPSSLLWAKHWNAKASIEERGPGPTWHPLVCHLVDAAMVARALWRRTAQPSLRERLSRGLNADPEIAGRWIVTLVGLHDLGKASPPFQAKWPEAESRLEEAGLRFRPVASPAHHGVVTAVVLKEFLVARGFPAGTAGVLALAVGGHHGVFPPAERRIGLGPLHIGEAAWAECRLRLCEALLNLLDADASLPARAANPGNSALALLAGLTSVADWIASAEELFPYHGEVRDIDAYATLSSQRAEEALDRVGWRSPLDHPSLSFRQTFPNIATPNQMQLSVVSLAPRLDGPCLVLVEAPMGQGKTEAALWLAHYLGREEGLRGAYVALPSEATSNQMFDRVLDFLGTVFPDERVNLQLVHGHATLTDRFNRLRLTGVSATDAQDGFQDGAVVAEEWFVPKKRALLASFGVGTVDQALLGVLRVRHGFVRLLGLAGKVVVVDEVHAYDTYTSTLLDSLLAWLAASGTSVILLSATLPTSRRQALLAAFGGGDDLARGSPLAPYPRITWLSRAGQGTLAFPGGPPRTVNLRRAGEDCPIIARRLLDELTSGGCAVWICNTVARAQAVYRLMSEAAGEAGFKVSLVSPVTARGGSASDDRGLSLDLFHARYLYEEREKREQRVLGAFGKKAVARPRRAVLVATQVVEQSLDLDFDLMVTDLAPVDLVLQRVGRLHRHRRRRPERLRTPSVWLVAPEDTGVPPDFGPSAYVYEEYVLLRSWLALRGRSALHLPADIDSLVQEVYGPPAGAGELPPADLHERLARAQAKMEKNNEARQRAAIQRLIKPPSHPDNILESFDVDLEEETPSVHEVFRALTRQGLSLEVACFYDTPGGLALDAEGLEIVNLSATPSQATTRSILRRSLRLSHAGLIHRLLATETPAGWRKSPFLRHHRPLIFADGVSDIGEWRLVLDSQVGLIIERKGGDESDT